MKSPKKIRTDFLYRPVEDRQQAELVKWLLTTMRYNWDRGAFTTSEHPFTASMGRFDTRLTTHYYPTYFPSSMYSTIHEGGHALFDQNQPQENHDHFISGGKTMGQHESVSRFYENRIGRSREFSRAFISSRAGRPVSSGFSGSSFRQRSPFRHPAG